MLPSGKFARFALAIASLLTGLVILVVEQAGHQPHSQLLSDLLQCRLVACAGIAAVRAMAQTAETHRANIMLKLNFHSVTDLVRYAVKNKIIQV